MVLAFFWGSFFLWRNIRLTSFKENEIFDGLFFSLFGALFFARLVYVALNFEKFGFDFFKFILINGFPGLSLYGAGLGGFLACYLFTLWKKINFREAVDYFIMPVFVGLIFGKLGSFFSGSEVATKTAFPLSIKYVGYDGLRHLTPLYESLLFVLGAYISYSLLFAVRREKYSHGFVFVFFLWYSSLIYFIFDKIKVNHLYLGGLSFNLMLSAAILLTTSVYFLYYFRNSLAKYVKTTFKKATARLKGNSTQRSKAAGEAGGGTKKK